MLDKFRGLSKSTKVLVICGVVAGVLAIGCIVAVLCTGGFTNPF